mmetsp:Transcript_14730/g.10626  ORF Transcript_14730/g.10626 Transcript_14730/m.10626 type:complete len:100 (+) Transcript_14730:821-1120(+)
MELKVKKNISSWQNTRHELNAKLITSLNTGGKILMKFDECGETFQENCWQEMFDPDIDHIIGMDALPIHIWRPQNLQNRQILEQCGVIPRDQDENSRIA